MANASAQGFSHRSTQDILEQQRLEDQAFTGLSNKEASALAYQYDPNPEFTTRPGAAVICCIVVKLCVREKSFELKIEEGEGTASIC